MTGDLIKRGKSDTDAHMGRTPREHKGGDQGDVSTGRGTPKTASKRLEARRVAWNGFPQPSERTNPADTLVSD